MNKNKKTFIINGGAGRVLTSIPALEKYAKNNVNEKHDFNVVVYGWDKLFYNHPILQPRTYSVNTKNLFENVIKPSIVYSPEPYHVYEFYNNNMNIIQAFDRVINDAYDFTDLPKRPNVYLSEQEIYLARKMIHEAKKQKNKPFFIVFQPYGSGMRFINGMPHDPSYRSLRVDDYLYLAHSISQHAVVLYFGDSSFIHPNDTYSLNTRNISTEVDIRFYMAMIKEADAFIGIDSLGQHLAYAFNKPGVVIMGGTSEINFSYPNHFYIYRNKEPFYYYPIRLAEYDGDLITRLNENTTKFTKEDLDQIYEALRNEIHEKCC